MDTSSIHCGRGITNDFSLTSVASVARVAREGKTGKVSGWVGKYHRGAEQVGGTYAPCSTA
jgi:hypothetical protein